MRKIVILMTLSILFNNCFPFKTKEESKITPHYEYDFMFRPTPLPTYETNNPANIKSVT